MASFVVSSAADTTIDPSHHNAYGANIGWIEARGDITNGAVVGQSFCSGYLYSGNCGWIGLGNGPTNGWHYSNLSSNDWGVNHDGEGNLSCGSHDEDHDGVPDVDEYPADTDPLASTSFLAVKDYQRFADTNQVTWSIEQTRFYRLDYAGAITNNSSWTDSGLGLMPPDPGASMTRDVIDPTTTTRFYRVRAVVPLSE